MDRVNGPVLSVFGTATLAGGLFVMILDPWRQIPFFAVVLAMGGFALARGLRALGRLAEVVQLRVEGRCLHIRGGPFTWGRRHVVNGALIRRLRVIREQAPYLDRDNQASQEDTVYTLMAELREGGEQVLARGFLSRAEPLWLALELHWALDLAEPVECLA